MKNNIYKFLYIIISYLCIYIQKKENKTTHTYSLAKLFTLFEHNNKQNNFLKQEDERTNT